VGELTKGEQAPKRAKEKSDDKAREDDKVKIPTLAAKSAARMGHPVSWRLQSEVVIG
jgi:hypothetical protein